MLRLVIWPSLVLYLRLNRDQVTTLETRLKIHTNVCNFVTASSKTIYCSLKYFWVFLLNCKIRHAPSTWKELIRKSLCLHIFRNITEIVKKIESLQLTRPSLGQIGHTTGVLCPPLFSNSGVGSFTSHEILSESAVRRGLRFFVLIWEARKVQLFARCHYKGSTFFSVIKRTWVFVRPGFEPATSRPADRRSANWANQAEVNNKLDKFCTSSEIPAAVVAPGDYCVHWEELVARIPTARCAVTCAETLTWTLRRVVMSCNKKKLFNRWLVYITCAS